ncbi:unnamed protein product [Hermetia illucens]|uniref:Transposase n=1 Tax=Hermetia illucens TaxID=343691 RepID=A0A7R8UCU1_HERIL|nr:unnamed protein product [Hermetia illucens]
MKQLSLSVYHISQVAYKYLAKGLSLPSEKFLRRYTSKWPTGPGIHDIYFESLKLKLMNQPGNTRLCMICVDEMSILPFLKYDRSRDMIVGFEDDGKIRSSLIAKSVVAFMARGITHIYKHLFGYAFVNTSCPAKKFKEMLFSCVEKLLEAGLYPKGIVCDQGPNFVALAKLLCISPEPMSFTIGVSKEEVFFMFDVPHLMKSVRNNLMKAPMMFDDGKEACWELIVEFYKKDSKQRFKLALKLARHHIYRSNFKKMKVKLATQVFNHTVAAGIYTRVSCNEISAKALETAEFLEDFDAVFDVCNSWKVFNSKKLRRTYKETSAQAFIKGWLISINSIEQIFAALQSEEFKFLFTRNLNQDGLEHTFGGNCEVQTEWTLPTVSLNIPNVRAPVIHAMPSVGDIHEMDINERNASYYVGGYICSKQHTISDSAETVYTHFRQYEGCSLYYAPEEFMTYLLQLEDEFCKYFGALKANKMLYVSLIAALGAVPYTACCEKGDKSLLLRIFVAVSVNNICKQFNSGVRDGS